MSYLVINQTDIVVNWENVDPVLPTSTIGIQVDGNNVKLRIGNGVDKFSELNVMWSGTNLDFQNSFKKISQSVQNVIETNISIDAAIKNVTDISTQKTSFNEYKIRQIMGVEL